MLKNKHSLKDILHSLIPSLFGILIFLFPIKYNGTWNIPIGIFSEGFANIIEPFSLTLLVIIIILSTVFSIISKIFISRNLLINNKYINYIINFFNTSTYYLIVKIISSIFIIMCYLNKGPNFILDSNTGLTMISLLKTLIAWFFISIFFNSILN